MFNAIEILRDRTIYTITESGNPISMTYGKLAVDAEYNEILYYPEVKQVTPKYLANKDVYQIFPAIAIECDDLIMTEAEAHLLGHISYLLIAHYRFSCVIEQGLSFDSEDVTTLSRCDDIIDSAYRLIVAYPVLHSAASLYFLEAITILVDVCRVTITDDLTANLKLNLL